MTTSTYEEYAKRQQSTLIVFQFIEEGLRTYISYCYAVVRKKLDNAIPFKFSYKDLENDSLGRLVDKLQKFNSDQKLVGNLKKLIKERNYVAHRSFLHTIDDQRNFEFLTEEIIRLDEVKNEAQLCLLAITNECRKLESLLRDDKQKI